MGHLSDGQTSLMRAEAMEQLGVNLIRFDARKFLDQRSFVERRLSDTFERSPLLHLYNQKLLDAANAIRPTVIWFDKPKFVTGNTIDQLKANGAFLIHYTPDPYFGYGGYQTRTTTSNFSKFDLFITTKSYELDDYRKFGTTIYMPHGYCDRVHRPVPVSESERVDFGFVGSWEPRREAFMERAASDGLSVRIWGLGWQHLVSGRAGLRTRLRLRKMSGGHPFSIRKSSLLSKHIQSGEVCGNDYAGALSASRISPGLLRTSLYPDQHTTRTFEIPACGSMLLAERTSEHEEFFDEDKEAVFFETEEEMVEKAVWYTQHPTERQRVTEAGRRRCLASGYSYRDRLETALMDVAKSMGVRTPRLAH
ncbi:MAG: glycosyltransferase [Pseudomonadota bacterium]